MGADDQIEGAEPDLVIGPLRLWASGRSAYPSGDPWWIDDVCCHLEVAGSGIAVEMDGVIPSRNFHFFHEQLTALHATLRGNVLLDGSDMGLIATIRPLSNGHLVVAIQLSVGGIWRGQLAAEVTLDQTDLPAILRQSRKLLDRFPVMVKI